MRSRTVRGFTLVEAIVALAVGVCVLGLVMSLMRWAALSFQRSEDRLDPRERAHFALATLRASLGDAWHYAVAADGAGVAFHGPSRDGEVRFDAARGRLEYRAPGTARPVSLVERGVTAFAVRVLRPGLLQLKLTIARPDRGGRPGALAPLSVTDELLIPAIALREAGPWSRSSEHRKALEPST